MFVLSKFTHLVISFHDFLAFSQRREDERGVEYSQKNWALVFAVIYIFFLNWQSREIKTTTSAKTERARVCILSSSF